MPMPVTMRHALANLYRPGSQSRAVLTALGVGVMFTLTVFLVQRSVLAEIRRSAPPGMANVFFIDITPEQRQPLLQFVSSFPGIEGKPEMLSAVSGGSSRSTGSRWIRSTSASRRRYRMAPAIATFDNLPPGTVVHNGAWWKSGHENSPAIDHGERLREP